MFRIPYYWPAQFDPGIPLYDVGQGGPQSHPAIQASQARTYPTIYDVVPMGMRGIMPRFVMGPTAPVNPNQYSNPLPINNLRIDGLMKNPIGG